MAGVYTDQRLNLSKLWEGPRKKCQGFKPDPGNPAVRDYRGASGNVSHGGNVHPSCNRKSRKRKPPTYSVARPISIPIKTLKPIDRVSRGGDHESPGRNDSERKCGLEKPDPRAEPASVGRRQNGVPKADRCGIATSAG